jgi:S1-C subfamily serine protease
MKRQPVCFLLVAVIVSILAQASIAKDTTALLRQHERNSISLDLEFSKKNQNPLQRVISFLNWGPNGYATGFLVGGRLVVTAYHVVSGDLDQSKKLSLGFEREDQLQVKVYTNGCQAKVIKVDKEADLALLEVCGLLRQSAAPAFQSSISKDEKLFLIARPHGDRIVGRGTFMGAYAFNGMDYWSVRISARDGYSGSPVYNEQGEVVGVFSGYDWAKNLAVISPGTRAQKLIEEYASAATP